jgi:Holliday junction resolvase RusA-like endonuclease
MKGDILLQNVQVRGFVPATAGKNAKEGKKKIRDTVETKLGKNIGNVRERCKGKPLSINVVFYLQKDTAHAKKDLDSLSNVLLDVLSKEMSSKESEHGLDIINDDSAVYKIVFEKKIVESAEEEGLAFSIYEWAYS